MAGAGGGRSLKAKVTGSNAWLEAMTPWAKQVTKKVADITCQPVDIFLWHVFNTLVLIPFAPPALSEL